jgi:hypothetical protein
LGLRFALAFPFDLPFVFLLGIASSTIKKDWTEVTV